MSEHVIDFHKDGAIGIITMNRPQAYNSFSAELRAELGACLERVNADADLRIVILRGAGRGFGAGADLSEVFPVPISDQLNGEYRPMIDAIHSSDKLFIAQVHGKAAGISAGFALACDFVVMAEDAGLYLAFAAIGLVPDGGLVWHLTRAMGPKKALETIVEGKLISAQEAQEFGLANKVVGPDELDAVTLGWAQSLAQGAPISMRGVKSLIRQMHGLDLGEAISAEAAVQDICQVSEDSINAIKAFATKEKVVFKGR